MIIVTDTHLEEESAELVLGQVLPGVLKMAHETGDMEVSHLGDLLSGRYRTPSRLIVALYDLVSNSAKEGISWRFLPGNHDQFDLDGRTVLEVLGEIPGVTVFKRPTWDQHGLWVPYQPTTEAFVKAIAKLPPRIPPPRRLWMHQGVLGSWMNGNVRDTDGVPLQAFSTWDKVFSGHYHMHHTVGNVTYIGTPWQVSASEAGQEKGFCRLDGGQLHFIKREWGARHVKLDITGEHVDLSGLRPTDIVTAMVPAGISVETLGKQFATAGIKNHTLTPELTVSEARLDVASNASMTAFAEAYVTKLAPAGLDHKHLMSIFHEVTA